MEAPRALWAILALGLVFGLFALYPLVHLVIRLLVSARATPSGATAGRALPIRWIGYLSKVVLLAIGALLYGIVVARVLLSFVHDPRAWF